MKLDEPKLNGLSPEANLHINANEIRRKVLDPIDCISVEIIGTVVYYRVYGLTLN